MLKEGTKCVVCGDELTQYELGNDLDEDPPRVCDGCWMCPVCRSPSNPQGVTGTLICSACNSQFTAKELEDGLIFPLKEVPSSLRNRASFISKRSDEEIDKIIYCAKDYERKRGKRLTKWPERTYEQGVHNAIAWVFGATDTHPFAELTEVDMSINLKSVSIGELEAELERRKEVLIEESKPKVLPKPNFDPLIKLCQKYLDDSYSDDPDEGMEHYIFEAAMQCVFGNDVFKAIDAFGR